MEKPYNFSMEFYNDVYKKKRLQIKVPHGYQKKLAKKCATSKGYVSLSLRGKRDSELSIIIRYLALKMGGWYN